MNAETLSSNLKTIKIKLISMPNPIRKSALSAYFLLAVTLAAMGQDRRENMAKCSHAADPDTKIIGCTELLQPGQNPPDILWMIYGNRGTAYVDKRDYARAIADYNEAISLNPNAETTYYGRGLAYKRSGESDRAIKDFDEAIRINPKFELAYYDRGNAYMNKDEYDRALQDFNKAIELKPNDPNAYNNRGVDYLKKGDFEHAIQDFNQTTRLNPNYVVAYINRGDAYLVQSNLTAAISDFEHVISIAPSSETAVSAAVSLHVILKQQGRDDSQQLAHVTAADLSKWPGPMLKFDRGQLTSSQVMAAAAVTGTERQTKWQAWQVCDANYLLGEDALFHHQSKTALTHLKAARDGCPKGAIGLPLALAELKKLGVSATPTR